jgi:hypothetical protein
MLHGQAVCKDCGNGTLNNIVNTQFQLHTDGKIYYPACIECGSPHIDGYLYQEGEQS